MQTFAFVRPRHTAYLIGGPFLLFTLFNSELTAILIGVTHPIVAMAMTMERGSYMGPTEIALGTGIPYAICQFVFGALLWAKLNNALEQELTLEGDKGN